MVRRLGECVAICRHLRPVGWEGLSLIFCKMLEEATVTSFRAAYLFIEKAKWRPGLLVEKQIET